MSEAAYEDLVRQLYGMGPVSRVLGRHAAEQLGSQGFHALAVAHVLGPVRPSEVAARLATDLSVVSRQLTALVTAGYITREPDPDDRRAHRVRSTQRGQEVLEASHARMVADVSEALSGWSDEDVAALTAGLTRLREDVARAAGLPLPITTQEAA